MPQQNAVSVWRGNQVSRRREVYLATLRSGSVDHSPADSLSRMISRFAKNVATPLRILGGWHLACGVAGVVSVLPVLHAAIRHPVGWITLGLIAVTSAVGVALFVGKRGALGPAAVLQGLQVLALSIPGVAVWIVRVGIRMAVTVPSPEGHSMFSINHDATVLTIWGNSARLPLGIAVNLGALVAFAVCLSCLPGRAGHVRMDSA